MKITHKQLSTIVEKLLRENIEDENSTQKIPYVDCPDCEGTGAIAGYECLQCGGRGKIID